MGGLAPAHIGPAADRLTIWPVDDGYELDATFEGATGFQRAERHVQELKIDSVPHSLRQELDGAWSIHFGPLSPLDVARALNAFVR